MSDLITSKSPNQSKLDQSTSPFNLSSSSLLSTPKISCIENNNIKVICRFRPLNGCELGKGHQIAEFPNNSTVSIHGKEYSNAFTYDRVFNENSSQRDIYEYSISQTVDDFLNGYNGTVLAYGQTGSGKSYTMMGPSIEDDVHKGLIPRISENIFKQISQGSIDVEYTVRVSYMEIHMEQIKDLLNVSLTSPSKFSIHEDKINGIYVKGLSQAFVSSPKELNHVLSQGLKARAIGSTNMNLESSRSHAIFQIKLSQKQLSTGTIKKSHLFLVDLAGSEKIDKTGAVGQTLEEAKKINSSLSALGNVINALTDGKSTHIPYRDSKLTRILQESLGGNSRTSLIINCSSSSINELETLSTLRFGSRAKSIKNNAHINTELSLNGLKSKISSLEKINEQNQLYVNQLESELLLWRSGERPTSFVGSQNLSSARTPTKEFQRDATKDLHKDFLKNVQQKEFQSRLPIPIASPILKSSSQNDEIVRRDKKISELENIILNMKMEDLRTSHQEESKLFKLEDSLHKLNDKLNDVELINNNLRKHLLISEKIIESRDIKINKLMNCLKEQQLHVSKESINFENKLEFIKERLDLYSKKKDEVVINENDISKNFKNQDKSIGEFLVDGKKTTLDENISAKNSNTIHVDTSGMFNQQQRSPRSPKIKLNLRIVKPLRGGGGNSINEDEIFF